MSKDRIEFEYIPLSQLVAYPRNPKSHDVGAIDQSIKRFGYVAPVIVDTNTGYIVAGHGRVETLLSMKHDKQKPPARIVVEGNDWLVPVNKIALADEQELLAYVIADNKLSEIGGWDDVALADALTELAGAGDGLLELTGFDGDDLDELLKTLEQPTPPADFKEFDEDIDYEYCCPKCNHKWSGRAK